MKNKNLELIFVLMVFLVLITATINNNTTTENDNKDINSDQPSDINASANWYLTIRNIYIADSGGKGNGTWVWARGQPWCNRGSGVLGDPYIIENITMDGPSVGSGIKIENSKVYFIIQNCTIYSSGSTPNEDAGITLVNTSNGIIRNNDCSENNRYGIFLKNGCNSNNISNNDVYESAHITYRIWNGIYLYNQCSYNTIESNTVYYSDDEGIYLQKNCNYNTIKDNIVNRSGDGIFIEDYSIGNKIFNNSLIDNGKGVYISTYCDDTIVSNNTIYDNYDGIYVYDHCNDNVVENNTIYNNRDHGIYIINGCEYNTITNNTIYQNEVGIKVHTSGSFCQYYNISGNILNNNLQYGIHLIAVMYVDLWENKMSNCGIYYETTNIIHHRRISISTNNTVNGRPVYYYVDRVGLNPTNFQNAGQLILANCNNSNIRNLKLTNCSIGLYMYKCNKNTIFNITTNQNTVGIDLHSSHRNVISNTTAKENIEVGIDLSYCDNNKIFDSTMIYNDGGIGLGICFNNTISNCRVEFNRDTGIYIGASDNNTLIKNTICNNSYEGTSLDAAIFSNGGCYNKIFENYICNNSNNGIVLWYSGDGNIISHNNTIYNNGFNGIYLEHECANNTISNNTVIYNQNGIYLEADCIKNYISENRILNNDENGIYFLDSSNNSIVNNNIDKNNQNGIYLETSDNIYITGNFINDNKNHGIYLDECTNSIISLNYFTLCGLYITGSLTELNSHQIDISNEINKKKLCYYTDQSGLDSSLFNNAGQIILINCNDTLISNVNVSSGSVGIMLYFCDNITINKTNSSNNHVFGFYLKDSTNCTLVQNTINYNEKDGIFLDGFCKYINITGNNVGNNLENGIYIYYSSNYNYISNNNISQNGQDGIHIEGTYIYITGNNITTNSQRGIFIYYWASNCQTWNNYFRTNGINAIDDGYYNSWDNDSLGNYWDDYTGYDNNNDGIGDVPYNIPGMAGSRDNYPIWGEPSNEAGEPSDGEDDSSEGQDKEKPSENNLTTFIMGGVIIGSIFALYLGFHVYSNKHPLRLSKISKEPILESPPEETDTLETKNTTAKVPQTKSTAKKSESYIQKPMGIDDFDQHFIQEKLRIKTLKTNDLYDEIIRNNSTIKNYLESDISIDDIPDGERLIATTLSEIDFRKIDLIDLPANDKKIFLMEILSLNTKERKTLLDDLIQNTE